MCRFPVGSFIGCQDYQQAQGNRHDNWAVHGACDHVCCEGGGDVEHDTLWQCDTFRQEFFRRCQEPSATVVEELALLEHGRGGAIVTFTGAADVCNQHLGESKISSNGKRGGSQVRYLRLHFR